MRTMSLRWPAGIEHVLLNRGQRAVVRGIYRHARTAFNYDRARARRDALYEAEQASWVHEPVPVPSPPTVVTGWGPLR